MLWNLIRFIWAVPDSNKLHMNRIRYFTKRIRIQVKIKRIHNTGRDVLKSRPLPLPAPFFNLKSNPLPPPRPLIQKLESTPTPSFIYKNLPPATRSLTRYTTRSTTSSPGREARGKRREWVSCIFYPFKECVPLCWFSGGEGVSWLNFLQHMKHK